LGYRPPGERTQQRFRAARRTLSLQRISPRMQTEGILYSVANPRPGLPLMTYKRLTAFRKVIERAVPFDAGFEHNLDIIKSADWIMTSDRKGGEQGGTQVSPLNADRSPKVARNSRSHTREISRARYLNNTQKRE